MNPRIPLLPAALGLCLAMPATAAPSFKDIAPQADATVSDTQPGTTYGTAPQAFLQSDAGGFGDQHTWLRFDLAGQLPPGASIESARLRFYVFDASGTGDLPVEAVGVGDGWSEGSLTWNAAQSIPVLDSTPAAGAQPATVTLERNRAFLWYEVDVTDFVAAQLAGDQLVSVALRPTVSDSSPGIGYRLDTREFGTNLAPRLRIEFQGTWPTSANDVTIIHTNDMHSRLNPHELDFPDADGEAPALEEAGGAPWVAAQVVALKQAHPDALVLDAGDISEGNPLGDLRGNGGSVAFFQRLDQQLKALGGRGVDAVVVGNHDVREASMLDNMRDPDGDGVANTPSAPGADPDDVPYLAVNLLNDGASVPAPAAWPAANPLRPYVVISLASGVKVGVLGYLTDDSAILTPETEPLVDVREAIWSDTDPGTVDLEPWVEHLRAVEGADIVVLLSHIGHRRLNATDQALLGDTGDVAPPDVVVSGHWHTWTQTAWQPSNLNYRTTNVEAASYGQYVGELTVTPEGRYLGAVKHPIAVADMTIPASGPVRDVFDDMNALLADLEAEYDALAPGDAEHDPCILVESGMRTEAEVQANFPGFTAGDNCPLDLVVGHSAVDLTLDKDKWNTLSEFPWSGGNTAGFWITDGMVWKVRDLLGAGAADLALQSGGGIRRDIAAGALTYREIYEAYPWDDDGMVRVQMTSAQVIDYIQGHFVGSSISEDWRIMATDGQVDKVEVDTTGDGLYDTEIAAGDGLSWNVIISEYMYENDDWINETSGTSDEFQTIDPSPEYLAADGTVSATPVTDPLEIRNSLIEYTAQFQATNPLTVKAPRYLLDTEIAGAFEAVVTMTADSESQPYFEGVFVRLLHPTQETLARRNLPGDEYGLDGLVNADGTINREHRFRETLLYRSHLGFPDGYLKPGDRLIINGEFGFFEGNPQFVDQEGIRAAETELDIRGHDPYLAEPDYKSRISEFWNSAHENHLVTFHGARTSDNTVQDAEGTEITVFREGGFFSSSTYLPGVNGDCLELTGVQTERADSFDPADRRRFRLRDASVVPGGAASCYPPTSMLTVSGTPEVGSALTLSASTEDLNGVVVTPASLDFGEDELEANGSLDDGTANWNRLTVDVDAIPGLDLANVVVEVRVDVNSTSENIFIDNVGLYAGGSPVQVQRFDTLPDGATFVTDSFPAGSTDEPLTNGSSQSSSGTGLENFVTRWTDTRGTEGPRCPTCPGGDGSDFIGVNSFTGFAAPDLAPDGTAVASGSEHNFEFNDGDGELRLVFDPVDLSGAAGARTLELDYWIHEASFEPDDRFQVVVRDAASGPGGQQLTGTVTEVRFYAVRDGGAPVLIATDSNGSDGWSTDFTPAQEGDYAFYSVAVDDDGNTEPAPFYADATTAVTAAPVPGPQRDEEIPFLPLWAYALLAALLGGFGARRAATRRAP